MATHPADPLRHVTKQQLPPRHEPAALDHLVVAASTLDDGARWCEAALGITPGPGGRHAPMGTHNRLFKIATGVFADAYFEIIAIDPGTPAPARARWFGLDAIDVRAGPRLIHAVARTPALDACLAALRAAGVDAGRALALSRDTASGVRLSWRIAVRDDGALLCGGALPTPIEWGPQHPTATMAASGVTLRALTLRGLPARAAQALALRGVAVEADAGAAITAELETPRGPVTLTTS